MARTDGDKPAFTLATTTYFKKQYPKAVTEPPSENPLPDAQTGEPSLPTTADEDKTAASGNPVDKQEPGAPVPELALPVPVMLERARKKSKRTLPDHWQRPFDGLRLWTWVLSLSGLRKVINVRYRNILVEWREGLNILVGNEKGGSSKTSVSVLLWLLLAWLLDKTIVLLDFNPAGGHARYRGGISKTVTMRQFLFEKELAPIESHQALSEQVGAHETLRNAYCIDWNDKEHKHLKKRLTEEPTVEKIQAVLEQVSLVSHATIIDQGNPLTGSWYEAAVKYRPERSVAVVTFMLDQEFSEAGVVATIDAQNDTEPTGGDRTVLVVMNYVGAWWRPSVRKRRREEIERLAYSYHIPKNRIVVIPRDTAFLNSDNIDQETGEKLPRVLDPRQLKLRTLAAGMKLLLVIALTSRQYRQLHPPTPKGN